MEDLQPAYHDTEACRSHGLFVSVSAGHAMITGGPSGMVPMNSVPGLVHSRITSRGRGRLLVQATNLHSIVHTLSSSKFGNFW